MLRICAEKADESVAKSATFGADFVLVTHSGSDLCERTL